MIKKTSFYEQQSQDFVAFFLSDVHLSRERPDDILRLEKFIDYLLIHKSKAQIFLLGDVFDFWYGFASPNLLQTRNLIQKLKKYNENNASVYIFEGNHDVHLSPYFQKQLGFKVITDHLVIELNNKILVLEHGDLFDPNDKSYLLLRSLLRNSFIQLMFTYIFPQKLIAFAGDRFSSLSSKSTKKRSEEDSFDIRKKFEKYANQQILKYEAEVFIAGHTHEVMKQGSGKGQIINLGSWFESQQVLCQKGQEFIFFNI